MSYCRNPRALFIKDIPALFIFMRREWGDTPTDNRSGWTNSFSEENQVRVISAGAHNNGIATDAQSAGHSAIPCHGSS
jgi:hypothetical protein